jgi:hypothetical protein
MSVDKGHEEHLVLFEEGTYEFLYLVIGGNGRPWTGRRLYVCWHRHISITCFSGVGSFIIREISMQEEISLLHKAHHC